MVYHVWLPIESSTMYDLLIRNGRVVTVSEDCRQDVAITDGRILALGLDLGPGRQEIDAAGKLLMPGGIDSHCHIEQMSSSGLMTADDFYSGSCSAAYGGTTTLIPFAAQHRGQDLYGVYDAYHACAMAKSVIDFGYHFIISDPTESVMGEQMAAMIDRGVTSFKIYMTYDALKLDDYAILNVLHRARELQSMVMVHAENHDVIRWLTENLLARGHVSPRYHTIAHARLAESEATHRAIALAELIDVPLLVVHVSSQQAMQEIRRAQERGLKIYAETCPQYLFLTAMDLDRSGWEGAMFCCSPPPRDKDAQEALWNGLANGTFQVFSSDHAPYRFDAGGKLSAGQEPDFDRIANGVPGLEIRLPMLYSEGVRKGRIGLHQFVALTATNAARLYGMYPQKGTIAVGSDADIVIWNSEKKVTLSADNLHDQAGYTPYEGWDVTGWPETVIRRGEVIIDDGQLIAQRGSGQYVASACSNFARFAGKPTPEIDTRLNFGVDFFDD